MAFFRRITLSKLSNMAHRDIETVLHPYTNLARHREVGPLILNEGRGIYLYDDKGKRYIEGLAGLWCTALGYGNEEIVDAAAQAMRKLSFTNVFGGKSHDGVIELSEKLKEIAPCPTSKVLFGTSGSEANDMQMKLTWYYNNARGKPEKKKIIARMRGYHGVTIASGSLTGLPIVHTDFDLPIKNVLHTSCPHYYRGGQESETEEQFTGIKGKYVPIAETIRGFKEIVDGKHDALPEQAFYLVGTIDDAIEKAKQSA